MSKAIEWDARTFSEHKFSGNAELHILDRRAIGTGFSGFFYFPNDGTQSFIPLVETGMTPYEVCIKFASNIYTKAWAREFQERADSLVAEIPLRLVA